MLGKEMKIHDSDFDQKIEILSMPISQLLRCFYIRLTLNGCDALPSKKVYKIENKIQYIRQYY